MCYITAYIGGCSFAYEKSIHIYIGTRHHIYIRGRIFLMPIQGWVYKFYVNVYRESFCNTSTSDGSTFLVRGRVGREG
jgi:hypothetical protein